MASLANAMYGNLMCAMFWGEGEVTLEKLGILGKAGQKVSAPLKSSKLIHL